MAVVDEKSAPGVYVDEQDATGPIAGAGTSTAAFLGPVAKLTAPDVVDVPVLVTNWTAYQNRFGGLKTDNPLSFAVRGFFENGGTTAYIVPIALKSPPVADDVKKALEALTRIRDVSLVCVPGVVVAAVQQKVLEHCQDMRNRFAILDGVRTTKSFEETGANAGELLLQRADLTSKGGYAAVYWPWIVVDDPTVTDPDPAKRLATVGPSGHVAGIMARSDAQYGVHKAPANEQVRGARALDVVLNDTEQGLLNKAGVNAIRLFPGGPPLVWGARTTTDGTAWRFVNVRRLVAFVEDSIQRSVRWAVFAPNGIALWKQLDRTITEFLTRVWQSGALFGRTAAEAFYVKVDEELNPASERALGKVTVEIGLAPVRPAEFVVLRFGLWDGPDQAQG